MRAVKRRLTFHFLIQYFTIALLLSVIVVGLVILLFWFIANEDMKRSFPAGALSSLATEINIVDGEATISKGWNEELKKQEMWFQIINEDGNEIASSNTPANVPKSYSFNELLKIDEENRFRDYHVYTEIDTFSFPDPYYYLLGYKDPSYEHLIALMNKYSQYGEIESSHIENVNNELLKEDETLHIVDANGEIIQKFGSMLEIQEYKPLEILSRRIDQGMYPTKISVISDEKSNFTWVLHSKNKLTKEYSNPTFFRNLLIAFIVVAIIVLVITISIAVWHGFRYGRPIVIFTSWLGRMEQGQYQEVLTERERKRIFRKSGKVRTRYRLYQEVFQAFYSMAERLSSAEKERKRLDQTREEWMTGISHDLRTPLSTVQGYGHLLESEKYEWSRLEIKDMGKVIREKGEYMLELVEDFSLAFQLKNNALEVSKEEVNINIFLRDIVSKYKEDRTLMGVNLSLVEEVDHVQLTISRKWFERIFDNLIMNAIKHNPTSTIITLIIKRGKNPDSIAIKIKDNGVGMEEEMKEKLFDRYYRGTNTEEKVDGAGLGMSIAKEIVKLHNGDIHVSSRVGEGTVITLTFPMPVESE
ncbi:sensor histidine kinase [Metabacillus halosaccharovorans]|uniref:sensor histidine kinase n=1 Tax=Metabacillus halosaccharovorans TaxID=930124 RepID=UPI00203B5D47|nr:HAMP domain-containing sensor histidine kinase [Metabacillus halosaccharovorans]MCM3444708.1 HAMP domain-containing histidine kinase [Metabacillus halosaccharovorans]